MSFWRAIGPCPLTSASAPDSLRHYQRTALLPARRARPRGERRGSRRRCSPITAWRGLTTFTIIDVVPAFVGLYERAAIWFGALALPLVNDEEFAALVAHEVGMMPSGWTMKRARQWWLSSPASREAGTALRWHRRTDRCPGGLNAEELVRAVELLTWYSRSRGLSPTGETTCPSMSAGRSFAPSRTCNRGSSRNRSVAPTAPHQQRNGNRRLSPPCICQEQSGRREA